MSCVQKSWIGLLEVCPNSGSRTLKPFKEGPWSNEPVFPYLPEDFLALPRLDSTTRAVTSAFHQGKFREPQKQRPGAPPIPQAVGMALHVFEY